MNGRIIVSKPLYVALAQRKEDRKAHLASQYMQRVTGMRMQQLQVTRASADIIWQLKKLITRLDYFSTIIIKMQ